MHTDPATMVLTRRGNKCVTVDLRRCLIGAGFRPHLRSLRWPVFSNTALLSVQLLWQNPLEKQLTGRRIYSLAQFQRFQSVATWPGHFEPEMKPNTTVGNVCAGGKSLSLLWPRHTEHVKGRSMVRWTFQSHISSELLPGNRSPLLIAHLPLKLSMDWFHQETLFPQDLGTSQFENQTLNTWGFGEDVSCQSHSNCECISYECPVGMRNYARRTESPVNHKMNRVQCAANAIY